MFVKHQMVFFLQKIGSLTWLTSNKGNILDATVVFLY